MFYQKRFLIKIKYIKLDLMDLRKALLQTKRKTEECFVLWIKIFFYKYIGDTIIIWITLDL